MNLKNMPVEAAQSLIIVIVGVVVALLWFGPMKFFENQGTTSEIQGTVEEIQIATTTSPETKTVGGNALGGGLLGVILGGFPGLVIGGLVGSSVGQEKIEYTAKSTICSLIVKSDDGPLIHFGPYGEGSVGKLANLCVKYSLAKKGDKIKFFKKTIFSGGRGAEIIGYSLLKDSGGWESEDFWRSAGTIIKN